MEKIKARNSLGKDYECKYPWEFFVQCGDSGVVFSKNGSYTTAFFEAFPKKPSCFLRGDGSTIEEAEESCWQKYQKVLTCNHEMERRDRTDGYAYCKHCSYSSTVFEPLTKCCKCGTPTSYTQDYKGKYYCKKHARVKPKNPDPNKRKEMFGEVVHHRVPRKYKKQMKKAAAIKFKQELGYEYKLKFKVNILNDIKITCGDRVLNILFEQQRRKLLDLLK
jgi:hypothetical protein